MSPMESFPQSFPRAGRIRSRKSGGLLYVAMTRAKDDLHLIAPLKYYVTSQSKTGDRHVYGAKSRFLTDAVMATLAPMVWPENQDAAPAADRGKPRIDVARKLRGMWS